MNVSELITQLKALRHQHGAEVEVFIDAVLGPVPIGRVEFKEQEYVGARKIHHEMITIEALG